MGLAIAPLLQRMYGTTDRPATATADAFRNLRRELELFFVSDILILFSVKHE
jgi:hypothetical protein